MKYVFHIHSNINLLVAIGVVEKYSYTKEAVIFLMNRGISTTFEVKKKNIPEDIYYHPFNTIRSLHTFKFFRNQNIINRIDAIVDEITNGSDFIYFCPNSRAPLYRAFYAHSRCQKVNYIEDGMDAYLSRKALEDKFPERVPRHLVVLDCIFGFFPWFCSSRLRYHDIGFMGDLKNNESKIYCINPKAYNNQSNVKKELIDANEILFFKALQLTEEFIFVFDAVVEQNVIEKDDLDTFIEWFCTVHFKGDSIAIKFHPFQSEENKKTIINICNENAIQVTVISDEIIMEVVFLKKKRVTIYGIGSSLLVYAAMVNDHKVEVLYPYFEKYLGVKSPRLSTWNAMFYKSKHIELLKKDN